MKRIEVKLSLAVVAPLLDVIKEVEASLEDDLAAALPLEQVAEELREDWRSELLAGQNGDVARLLALFDSDFFASGVVAIDEDNADSILKACAAVRLRLRDQFSGEVSDEMLEHGEVDMDVLPEADRRAFMCYLFLATVQELIIEHLESSLLDG